MMYTPEDQLRFLKESGFADDFYKAILNNDSIRFSQVNPKDFVWKNGQLQVTVQPSSGDAITFPDVVLENLHAEDGCRKLCHALRDERIAAGVVGYRDAENPDNYYLLLAMSDQKVSESKLNELLMDQLFLFVIQACGLNSHRKLKVFIRQGWSIHNAELRQPAAD